MEETCNRRSTGKISNNTHAKFVNQKFNFLRKKITINLTWKILKIQNMNFMNVLNLMNFYVCISVLIRSLVRGVTLLLVIVSFL